MKLKFALSLCLGTFLMASALSGVFNDESPCFKDLQTHFFRPDLVMEALSLHEVYQSQWQPIVQKLQDSSKDVPQLLKLKAENLELSGQRNPLLSPFDPEGADKLLNEILMQVFTNVLRESNVLLESDIKDMYVYIRNKQTDRLKACYGQEVKLQGQ